MNDVKRHVTLGDILALVRVKNSAMVGLAVLVGEALTLRGLPPVDKAIIGFLAGFLISGGAMITNDIFDVEVDRINAPHRPLARGAITISTATTLATTLYIGGVLLSLLLSLLCGVIALSFALLSLLYNYRLKEEGLIGNAVVSLSVAIPYLFGAIAVGSLANLVVIFALISFVANLGREIVKGVPDVPGDAARHVKTLARTWGPKTACVVGALLIMLAIAISFAPPLMGLTGLLYLPTVVLADVILFRAALSVLRDHGPSAALKAKDDILKGMLVGLLAFLVGGLLP